MPDDPPTTEAGWRRRFAVASFNATWDLIDNERRTADEELEMLLSAAASRWLWGAIGGPEQTATGDWQVAHVASLLGRGELARRFAARNLVVAQQEGWDGWRLASAHEGMARACAACGDGAGRADHLLAAREALEREPDGEERAVIEAQIESVPDS